MSLIAVIDDDHDILETTELNSYLKQLHSNYGRQPR